MRKGCWRHAFYSLYFPVIKISVAPCGGFYKHPNIFFYYCQLTTFFNPVRNS